MRSYNFLMSRNAPNKPATSHIMWWEFTNGQMGGLFSVGDGGTAPFSKCSPHKTSKGGLAQVKGGGGVRGEHKTHLLVLGGRILHFLRWSTFCQLPILWGTSHKRRYGSTTKGGFSCIIFECSKIRKKSSDLVCWSTSSVLVANIVRFFSAWLNISFMACALFSVLFRSAVCKIAQ